MGDLGLPGVGASRRLCRERENATYLIAKGGDRRLEGGVIGGDDVRNVGVRTATNVARAWIPDSAER